MNSSNLSSVAAPRLSAHTKACIVELASQAWEGTIAQFRSYMRLINDVLQESGDGLALVDDETPGVFVRGGAEWADTVVFCLREGGQVDWDNGVDVDSSAFEADLKRCFDKALANLRFERVGCFERVRSDDGQFVTVPTHELEGAALEWAVAMCEGRAIDIGPDGRIWHSPEHGESGDEATYLTWTFAGPIIDREGIAMRKHGASGAWYAMALADIGDAERPQWCEFTAQGGQRHGKFSYQVHMRRQRFEGATALEAALRCYVASKLGESVELPAELRPTEGQTPAQAAQRPRG